MFPILFAFGPVKIHTYSLFLILGLFLGLFVFWKRAKNEYYEEMDVFDVALMSTLWAVIGGRLLYILLHFSEFGINILYWIAIWAKPGFFWPGMYGAAIWCFVKMSKHLKWNTFQALDLAVIGVALTNFFVHLGQFFAGGGRAVATTMPWGVMFAGSFEPRHPVSLYAAIIWILLFVYLWWVEDKYRRFVWYQRFKGDSKPGFLIFTFAIVQGLMGLVFSFLQIPEYIFMGIDISFVLYFTLLVIGCIGILVRSGLGSKWGLEEYFSLPKSLKKRSKGEK